MARFRSGGSYVELARRQALANVERVELFHRGVSSRWCDGGDGVQEGVLHRERRFGAPRTVRSSDYVAMHVTSDCVARMPRPRPYGVACGRARCSAVFHASKGRDWCSTLAARQRVSFATT